MRAPVIVRTVDAASQLKIQVNLAGATRSLLRPCAEALDKSLARLSSAAAGKVPKKKGAAKTDAPAPIAVGLVDAFGGEIALDTAAKEAWRRAAWLHVGTEPPAAILFEPPEVEDVVLPAAPLVGIPLVPLVTARNCHVSDCTFAWERCAGSSGGDDAAVVVGTCKRYTPTSDDVGARLRLRIHPPAPSWRAAPEVEVEEAASMLLRRELMTESQVAAPPARPLLDMRVAAMAGQQSTSANGFRLLTYNLMAETCALLSSGVGSR